MICDPESGELVNKASQIMESVKDKNRYSYELLLSEIEINTPICDTVNQSINFLSNPRVTGSLSEKAQRNGFSKFSKNSHAFL